MPDLIDSEYKRGWNDANEHSTHGCTEISEHNMDYHLNTIKDTLDYLHATRLNESSVKLDIMIHGLTKVVRLIKEIKEVGNS